MLSFALTLQLTSSDLNLLCSYHFDWTKREYRIGFKSEFPDDLADIGCSVVQRLQNINKFKFALYKLISLNLK